MLTGTSTGFRRILGPAHHAALGSVISKLLPTEASMPSFVGLPERIGTTAGFLTPDSSPVSSAASTTFTIDQHPDEPNFKIDMLAQRRLDPVRVAARKDCSPPSMRSHRLDVAPASGR
jgi:hypothetical protein